MRPSTSAGMLLTLRKPGRVGVIQHPLDFFERGGERESLVVAKVMWFDRVAVLLLGLALMLALGGCGERAARAPQDKPGQSRAMPTEIELQRSNESGVK